MKKNLLRASLGIFVLSCVLVVFSCKKKDDPKPLDQQTNNNTNNNTSNTSPTFVSSISSKWIVGDGSAKISAVNANTSGYNSFEFTNGYTYIITKTDGTFLTGTYTADSVHKQITLANCGVVTITQKTGNQMNFTLRLTGTSTDVTLFTTQTSVSIASDIRTDSLCQTWVMVTMYMNGVENTQTKNAIVAGTAKATVIITKAGTFMTIQEISGSPTQYATGTWSWSDGTETTFCKGTTSPCTADRAVFADGLFYHIYTQGNTTFEEVYQLQAVN